ncbi:MAG: hypothetical protein ICV77_05210 [Cyanobacteria bacterium Co-bin8]|nr:hypothetical protein [Cyanobacteria bacterium Co-bin8]MBD2260441.1 hypothetical protein [Pseudanabaena sp. FACHB-2040]
MQQELNRLEELILGSPRVPLSGRTLVDEDQMLDQLDLVRLNLPTAFREASQITQQRDIILAEAQRYAQELVAAAEQQAAQMLDEQGIVRQAEQMAQQIKTQAQQDCDALRSQVVAEIDQMRLQAQREWESMRQQALAEKNTIQDDADSYAGDVLGQLERNLTDMLRVIQNGRQQLQRSPSDAGSPAAPTKRSAEPTSPTRSNQPSRPDRPRR